MSRSIIPQGPHWSRRDVLRTLFFTAGAVGSASWLSGCGGSGSGASGATLPPPPGMGEAPDGEVLPETVEKLLGRFRNIGPLRAPDVHGVRTPEGFATRIVAINGELPQPQGMAVMGPRTGGIGNRPWHIFPDGGGVVPRDNGG